MAKTFVISDEHYGHRNIIQFCKRPFSNVEEMAESLIERHNEKVGVGDHTWHLGDMFWRTLSTAEALNILGRLNGTHSLIRGNHEEVVDGSLTVQSRFLEIEDLKVLPVPNMKGQKLILCHYAMRVWPKSHSGSWHLYGHSHGELPEQGLSFDVGVDNPITNFAPMEFEEVKAEMLKRKSNHVIPADKVWDKTFDHLPEGSY